MGFGYVYGPGIPMTPTQAGMSMLMMQQRMLGWGMGSSAARGPRRTPGEKTPVNARLTQARTIGPGSHPSEAATRRT